MLNKEQLLIDLKAIYEYDNHNSIYHEDHETRLTSIGSASYGKVLIEEIELGKYDVKLTSDGGESYKTINSDIGVVAENIKSSGLQIGQSLKEIKNKNI